MLYWAIIGSGDVVNRLVRKSFLIPKKSKVKYVFSKNFAEAKKLVKKYKLGKAVKDLNIVIKDKDVNSIYIATPPNFHYNYIKKFAAAKKNIFCEKPLVIKRKHINSVKKICEKNRISLVTSFYRRYLKRFNYIRKLLVGGKIGKIVYFRVTLTHSVDRHPTAPININKLNKTNIPWRFRKSESGGGNFIDMGSHAIDLIAFLLDDIKKVYCLKKNYTKYYDVEDTLIINIKLNNGIIGQGVWSSVTKKNIDNFEIFGTKGYIKFSMSFSNLVEVLVGKKRFIKSIPFEKPFYKNIVKYVVDKFLNKIKYKNYMIDKNGLKTSNIQIDALK